MGGCIVMAWGPPSGWPRQTFSSLRLSSLLCPQHEAVPTILRTLKECLTNEAMARG